jgi:hypothetical protein
MNSEPVRLRSRVSARRGQGYFTPLATFSIKGGGGDAGIGDINSVGCQAPQRRWRRPFRHKLLCGIWNHLVIAAQKDKKRGLPSVQSLE